MNHHHEIRYCACGAVVSQCRCPALDKTKVTVRERCSKCVSAAMASDAANPCPQAVEVAKRALEVLGREDLLFSHHAEVIARPDAYRRLAMFFEEYGGRK